MFRKRIAAVIMTLLMLLNMNGIVVAAEALHTEQAENQSQNGERQTEQDAALSQEIAQKSADVQNKEEKEDSAELAAIRTEKKPTAKISPLDSTSGDLTYSVSGSNAIITGYVGEGGTVTIPDMIGEYTVTEIETHAFYDESGITAVNLPSKLTTLGYEVFKGKQGNGYQIRLSATLEDGKTYPGAYSRIIITCKKEGKGYFKREFEIYP